MITSFFFSWRSCTKLSDWFHPPLKKLPRLLVNLSLYKKNILLSRVLKWPWFSIQIAWQNNEKIQKKAGGKYCSVLCLGTWKQKGEKNCCHSHYTKLARGWGNERMQPGSKTGRRGEKDLDCLERGEWNCISSTCFSLKLRQAQLQISFSSVKNKNGKEEGCEGEKSKGGLKWKEPNTHGSMK